VFYCAIIIHIYYGEVQRQARNRAFARRINRSVEGVCTDAVVRVGRARYPSFGAARYGCLSRAVIGPY
jgi:hypothetical protein